MVPSNFKSAPAREVVDAQMNELKEIKLDSDRLKTELNTAQTKYNQRLSDYEAELEQLQIEVEKNRDEQEEKETNLLHATNEWIDLKTKLESNAVLPEQKVTLNVGGVYFETTIETLTKYTEGTTSYFQAIFSRQWQLEKDSKDDRIFINRDGNLFGYILQYLRTGELTIDVENMLLRKDLITEGEFYKIQSLVQLLKINNTVTNNSTLDRNNLYSNTKLLSYDHQEHLNKLFGSANQQWQLIYCANRDGSTAKSFHQFCDGSSPTMCVIRSKNGFIFGGFTTIAWSSSTQDKSDAYAFLYTLTNPHGIPPTRYSICEQSARFAVSHRSTNGPAFGSIKNGGNDLHLRNLFNADDNRVFFPKTYEDTTGKGQLTFTGHSYFACDNMEVFVPV